MPNGYTAIIYEDKENKITFEDFAYECTCAYGARVGERHDEHNESNRKPQLPVKPD